MPGLQWNIFFLSDSGTAFVLLLTGAAPAPWRPFHAGAVVFHTNSFPVLSQGQGIIYGTRRLAPLFLFGCLWMGGMLSSTAWLKTCGLLSITSLMPCQPATQGHSAASECLPISPVL